MDPLSVAGLSLGVASLTGQLFNGCITGINFLVDLVEMPKSCASRKLRLLIEYNRLVAWGKASGLVELEPGSSLPTALGVSVVEIAAILSEVRTLLEEFACLNSRHEELGLSGIQLEAQSVDLYALRDIPPIESLYSKPRKPRTWSTKAKTVVSSVKTLGGLKKRPVRILWVLVDEKKFDSLLVRLRELIDHLYELVNQHRLDELRELSRDTIMEMIQLRESLTDLRRLVVASAGFGGQRPAEFESRLGLDRTLHELAQLKEIAIRGPLRDMAILSHQLCYRRSSRTEHRTRGVYTSSRGQRPVLIWIEWKYCKAILDREPSGRLELAMPSTTMERSKQLANLLSSPKPADFCTPQCLGYTVEVQSRGRVPSRLGWVFRMPDHVGGDAVPRSLLWLFSSMPQPPLTDRVALAKKIAACILNIHAVNWLHKAIRSENIIFIYDTPTPDLTNPILSGFDISRHENHETTERHASTPEKDIYQWPSMQGDEPANGRSRKIFDIYGFGLLLLELAHWMPLCEILGFQDPAKIGADEARDVRNRLLTKEPRHLDDILRTVGRRYHATVKRCLQGYATSDDGSVGLGILASENEREADVSIKLQRCYSQNIVKELQRMEL